MCGVWYTWIAACCLVEDLPLGHQGYLMVVVASDREAAMVGFGSMQLSELTQGETLDVLVVLPNAEKRLPSNLRPSTSGHPITTLRRPRALADAESARSMRRSGASYCAWHR